MTQTETHWHTEHHIETTATVEAIWRIFQDTSTWNRWNEGIERIDIEGPFAAGTWFTMKPPGQEVLRSRLLEVRDNEYFVDETRVGDLVVTVTHRIERLGVKGARVTYSIETTGAGAAEIGPAIAADFPVVLSALARTAEQRS